MALSLGPIHVGNPLGLYALLSLVPLIILYLIRPRPKKMNIPSLMFFVQRTGARKLTSFLKHITRDWLFLIQLIALLAMALTFAQPFTTYQHDVTSTNSVIVIDVSASSQALEGSRTRFELAVSEAKKALGAKNTIVLAKDIPQIAVQDVSGSEAIKYLNSLQPKGTISKIGEAMILAGETLTEGRVVVISDFINTEGQDPEIAKSVLEAKGVVVNFINVGAPGKKNVGIVDVDAGNDVSTVYVKNYDDEAHFIDMKIGATTTQMNIPGRGTESFSFKTPPGVNKIEIAWNDALPIDNVGYLSAPAGGRPKVLLITNNESIFLRNALEASGELDVTVTEPPVITDGDFDVYIVDNIDMGQMLPGTFEDLLELAREGATVIVAVQDETDRIDYRGLLPMTFSGRRDGGLITVDQLNQFTKNIDFGRASYVLQAELEGEHTVIASVSEVPVMTLKPEGAGKIVYYGIPEGSDFKFSPSYPIFWTELMKYVTEQQDVRNLNFKAGDTLILDGEQRIKTPSKTVKRAALVLDEISVYELEDRVIAVNLASQKESNINFEAPAGTKSFEYELRPVKETREFHWAVWLLALALILTVFEIWFVRSRGDV